MAFGTKYFTRELTRFADATDSDERTVAKVILGKKVKFTVAERIRKGLEKFDVYAPSPVRHITPVVHSNKP